MKERCKNMKITEQWLKRHLVYDIPLPVICEKLTLLGFEVEEVYNEYDKFGEFVIAEIKTIQKHPNADRLHVCEVYDGVHVLQIVCGAQNIRCGMKVTLAHIGAILPSNGIKIQHTLIRGIESYGMLCSLDELGLTEAHHFISTANGIAEVPEYGVVGETLAKFLGYGDTIIDIAITPNRRQDGSSVYGIARDLYAAGIGNLVNPAESLIDHRSRHISKLLHETKKTKDDTADIVPHDNNKCTYSAECGNSRSIDVEILAHSSCYMFQLQVIHNIDQECAINNISYCEIKKLLELTNHVHNNPLVNISNFLMFDYGRPNHIYDADKICGKVSVRYSVKGEVFTPIGMDQITLPEGILIITDKEKVLAIAGIIGGELSKVSSETVNIAVEVANFAQDAVIHAGRMVGIQTESRFRFEGRVDSGNDMEFKDMLCHAILSCCGGVCGICTCAHGDQALHTEHVIYDPRILQTFAGYILSDEDSITILKRLGFIINTKSYDEWVIKVPSWRLGNITTQYSIVEEIIRIHGIEHIQDIQSQTMDDIVVSANYMIKQHHNIHNVIVETLLARGMDEVIGWSFISAKQCEDFGLTDVVHILNPIVKDFAIMRSSLVPGLLQVVEKNCARGIKAFCIFEGGNLYKHQQATICQTQCFAGLRTGKINTHNIHKDNREWDFYDVRDDVLKVMQNIGVNVDEIDIEHTAPGYYHPARCATFVLNGNIIGYCGELHPTLALDKKYIITPICVFEVLDYCNDAKCSSKRKSQYQPSPYQAIERDLAFVVDCNVMAGNLRKTVQEINCELIKDVQLFDVYIGPQLEEGKKSIAIRITLQSCVKTLTESDILHVIDCILDVMHRKFGAFVRNT